MNRRIWMAAGAALVLSTALQAQTVSKPMRIIVSFAPGGPVDFTARTIAEPLGRALGRTVIIENKPGANGAIGAAEVLRSEADGSTVWITSVGAAAINPALYEKLPYNPQKDFAPVSLVTNNVEVFVVNAKDAAREIPDFIAAANGGKGGVAVASSGRGSIPHLALAQMELATNVDFLHVPYNGLAPAITDVVGGRVDFMFAPIAGPVPGFMENASLKSLAVSSIDVQPRFPKLPTMRSIKGFEDYVFNIWIGIQTGAKVSDAVAATLHKSAYAAMANPETKKALEATGSIVSPALSLAEVEAFYKRETAAYQAIAKAIKLSPQ